MIHVSDNHRLKLKLDSFSKIVDPTTLFDKLFGLSYEQFNLLVLLILKI